MGLIPTVLILMSGSLTAVCLLGIICLTLDKSVCQINKCNSKDKESKRCSNYNSGQKKDIW